MVDGMDTALPSEVMKRTHGCRVGMREGGIASLGRQTLH